MPKLYFWFAWARQSPPPFYAKISILFYGFIKESMHCIHASKLLSAHCFGALTKFQTKPQWWKNRLEVSHGRLLGFRRRFSRKRRRFSRYRRRFSEFHGRFFKISWTILRIWLPGSQDTTGFVRTLPFLPPIYPLSPQ